MGRPYAARRTRAEHVETVEDGLQVFHNPFGRYRLDPAVFRRPSVVQHYKRHDTQEWVYEESDSCLHFRMVHTVRAAPKRGLAGGTETILLVEDNADVQFTVGELLEELGYRVFKASDAETALKIIEEESIAVLFADVVMPGPIGGMELAQKAKAIRPQLIILLTSGYLYDSAKRDGWLAQDIHLLKKPYRQEQLDSAIRNLLTNR